MNNDGSVVSSIIHKRYGLASKNWCERDRRRRVK
jgi:hypothetical protein